MATSDTEIINSALIKCGADTIAARTDNNARANLADTQFDVIRKRVLTSHPWNFSTKRIQLARLAAVPLYEYEFYYQIPSDCLRIFRTKDQGTFDYKIEGDRVATSHAEVFIEYSYNNEDYSQYPYTVSEHIAWECAYDWAYKLTQSNSFKTSMKEDKTDARRDAKLYDGQEGTPRSYEIDEWTSSRRQGSLGWLADGKHP